MMLGRARLEKLNNEDLGSTGASPRSPIIGQSFSHLSQRKSDFRGQNKGSLKTGLAMLDAAEQAKNRANRQGMENILIEAPMFKVKAVR